MCIKRTAGRVDSTPFGEEDDAAPPAMRFFSLIRPAVAALSDGWLARRRSVNTTR
jgi:hypothetical protein